MTLAASVSTEANPTIRSKNSSFSDDNDDRSCSSEENGYPIDMVEQRLGHQNNEVLPQYGNVLIENSSDVHFGDKNIYQGPVTIKQTVYANAAPLVAQLAQTKICPNDNPAFECDTYNHIDSFNYDLNSSKKNIPNNNKGDRLPTARDNFVNTGETVSGHRKGFLWFINILKQRPVEIGVLSIIVVISIVILLLVLRYNLPLSASKAVAVIDTDEQDKIQPIEYDTDITATSQIKRKLRIISRFEWVAQPPINASTPLKTPVPYVLIHHTATENCSSQAQCVFHVRYIQTFHIESRGFWDIGYNFLVGGDGAAYEGRGWTNEGAHLFGYNSRSIGIAFIGTFISFKPPEIQILACKKLIEKGLELGYIAPDYKLLAARQLSGTESPGATLYEELKTWPHWATQP